MTFLPIIERELRVGARRRMTFWGRVVAAGLVLGIFGVLQSFFLLQRGVFPFQAGQVQFAVLRWLSFGFAFTAGMFLTSDTLSEEKREGTLGLLFLTDLRGYDVVLGKLVSASVQAFYALLAAFPIIALSLLQGGVTPGEFWESILVLCNTLFLSIAIGLFVSSLSRDSQRAMNGVLLALLLLVCATPVLDYAMGGWNVFVPRFTLLSPGHLFANIGGFRPGDFWLQVALQQGLGWVLLGAACYITPRTWQERGRRAERARKPTRFGVGRYLRRRRGRVLDRDPLLWLAMRDRWQRRLLWAATAILLIMVAWWALTETPWSTPMVTVAKSTSSSISSSGASNTSSTSVRVQMALGFMASAVRIALLSMQIWMASQASRFFISAVRNGALELILVAPVGPDQIVRAQWKSLKKMFFLPALALGLLNLGLMAASLWRTSMMMKSAGSAGKTASPTFNFFWPQLAGGILHFFTIFTALSALAWFGMWMGLTTRKPTIAVLKNIAFVVVLPGIAIMMVQGFTMLWVTFILKGMGAGILWVNAIVAGVLTMAKDGAFIVIARHKLRTNFRDAVAFEGYTPKHRMVIPPPVPPSPPAAPPPLPGAVGPARELAGSAADPA